MIEREVGEYVNNVHMVRKPYDLTDLFYCLEHVDEWKYPCKVRIDLIKDLNAEEFKQFTSDFFKENVGILLYVGGTDSIENYVHTVLVRNTEGPEELFVNTEGYKYARYVGIVKYE